MNDQDLLRYSRHLVLTKRRTATSTAQSPVDEEQRPSSTSHFVVHAESIN